MDLSKVEQNEEKSQNLIKLQEGDGSYNPITGTYKWGSNVYDLTKTNGEPGLGWLPIRNKPLEYKTIHQNKSELEQFYSAKKEYNSQKFEYKEEDYWIKQISNLQRYYNSVEHGCPIMEEYEYGEYVKLEDVLELVSAEKT